RRGDRDRLTLTTDPDLAGLTVRRDGGRGIQRLHLRVVRVIASVLGLEDGLRLVEGRSHVAGGGPRLARRSEITRSRRVSRDRLVTVESPARRLTVPRHSQGVLRGERGPRGVGDDAH